MTTAYVFKYISPSVTNIRFYGGVQQRSKSLVVSCAIHLVCNPNQWLHEQLEFFVFLCNILITLFSPVLLYMFGPVRL